MASPMGETRKLGAIFLLVFAAYYTLQGYAAILLGPALASDALVALYAVFTVACFFAPMVAFRLGPKVTLGVGVVGYGAFAAAALVYAVSGDDDASLWPRRLVVGGGAVNGAGAALLWTAQGELMLRNARRDEERDLGAHFAVFWALFNVSAVAGGLLSFGYFSSAPASSGTSNAPLYAIFTALIFAGGLATTTLEDDDASGGLATTSAPSSAPSSSVDVSPRQQARDTVRLCGRERCACLLPLFWYTGFNQPYQLDGFADRFFAKRVVGLELAVFYALECVGTFFAGRALDGPPGGGASSWNKRSAARRVLGVFFLLTTLGYAAAAFYEVARGGAAPERLGLGDGPAVLGPTIALAAWGLSDSLVQTYAYWLIGALYPAERESTRVIALYKLVQSAGWCAGYAILPGRRVSDLHQLTLTGLSFVLGTSLALLQLPKEHPPHDHRALLTQDDDPYHQDQFPPSPSSSSVDRDDFESAERRNPLHPAATRRVTS